VTSLVTSVDIHHCGSPKDAQGEVASEATTGAMPGAPPLCRSSWGHGGKCEGVGIPAVRPPPQLSQDTCLERILQAMATIVRFVEFCKTSSSRRPRPCLTALATVRGIPPGDRPESSTHP